MMQSISVLPDLPISEFLVAVFKKNAEAKNQISLKFVTEVLQIMVENITTAPQVSLDSLKILTSMVTSDVDDILAKDNGNIIMLDFMTTNTRLARENPLLPIAYEGFSTYITLFKDDQNAIEDYLKAEEDMKEKREALM